MPAVQLPILTLAVREQRYSCHGCGNCCRDFTVQLRDEDLSKLRSQGWEQQLGEPVTIDFRGVTYLRQREDGSCIFLMPDGLCRIHKEFGFAAKPIACQLFPFHLTPTARGIEMGINFACQSVLENKGAELKSHEGELRRMTASLRELHATPAASGSMLNDKIRASKSEMKSLVEQIDCWMRQSDLPLAVRLDGLAWVVGSLRKAKLENVRETRFSDLLDVLFGALPEELQHHPVQLPTPRQRRLLRQAAFARTEDPKLHHIASRSRIRLVLEQLARSRRFKSGKGSAPKIGQAWPENASLETVESIEAPQSATEAAAIDELLTRYVRASVLGERCWGAGYYGWSAVAGLEALLLNLAVVGWLARLRAAGRGAACFNIEDVRAALGRIDRTHGRAKWLGTSAERLRLHYLDLDDGLRRLLAQYRVS